MGLGQDIPLGNVFVPSDNGARSWMTNQMNQKIKITCPFLLIIVTGHFDHMNLTATIFNQVWMTLPFSTAISSTLL